MISHLSGAVLSHPNLLHIILLYWYYLAVRGRGRRENWLKSWRQWQIARDRVLVVVPFPL